MCCGNFIRDKIGKFFKKCPDACTCAIFVVPLHVVFVRQVFRTIMKSRKEHVSNYY